jgi:hypothetical protein
MWLCLNSDARARKGRHAITPQDKALPISRWGLRGAPASVGVRGFLNGESTCLEHFALHTIWPVFGPVVEVAYGSVEAPRSGVRRESPVSAHLARCGAFRRSSPF